MDFDAVEKPPKLSEFDLEVPEELIAQTPPEKRDQCRLMVADRATKEIGHYRFDQLGEFLNDGDALILNDTEVLPARIMCTKNRSDTEIEVLLLRELETDMWEALVRPSRKVRVGTRLHFNEGVYCDVIDNTTSGGRVIQFYHDGNSFDDFLDRYGNPPLPPYIKRKANEGDKTAYQTVFAHHRGAVAAPTAGLHFARETLQQLSDRGVRLGFVTLHVGLGTFRPVRVEDISRHHMDAEYYRVPKETADLVNATMAQGKRVVAVGTTVTRTLETVADQDHHIRSGEGWTDRFIYPPYHFKAVNILLTNFHQPKSTLIMLVSAFAGKTFLFRGYQEAIRERYRFYSYGDAMLIL